jgi:hypothetical protein
MLKNNKTNKSQTNIEWPEGHFTIEDIQVKYPDAVNITLRFRVKKAEEKKEIVLIGKVKPAIGRPRKVYAKANPSKELLAAATAAGVISLDSTKATVTVGDVRTTNSSKVQKISPVNADETKVSNQATV